MPTVLGNTADVSVTGANALFQGRRSTSLHGSVTIGAQVMVVTALATGVLTCFATSFASMCLCMSLCVS